MLKLKMFFVGVFFSLVLSASVFAGVSADDVTVMPVHNTSKFFVSFTESVAPQEVTIRIRSANGNLIFTDKLATDKVTKVYDMAEYGKKAYRVEIVGADFIIKKSVELGKTAGFEAKVNQHENYIQLLYSSRDAELAIYLKDAEGNVLYQGNGEFGKYQQSFDISKLPAGKYTLKVTNGEQIFEEKFEVK